MKYISTVAEYNAVLGESNEHPVIILKHSTTCPISAGGFERVEKGIESGDISVPVYVVVVQDARELSDYIARELDVQHESPQAIVLKDGETVFDTSHHDITVEVLASHIK